MSEILIGMRIRDTTALPKSASPAAHYRPPNCACFNWSDERERGQALAKRRRLAAMRGAAVVILFLFVTSTASCGFLSGHPGWCGSMGRGGRVPPSGVTFAPLPTPDPTRLLCIAAVNRSHTDMGMIKFADGEISGWSLIAACSGVVASEDVAASGSWRLEVGRAVPGSIDGPALAHFDSSDATAVGPYLIEVRIGADRTVSMEQRRALPDDPAVSYC
jgi:hypothetical protein